MSKIVLKRDAEKKLSSQSGQEIKIRSSLKKKATRPAPMTTIALSSNEAKESIVNALERLKSNRFKNLKIQEIAEKALIVGLKTLLRNG